MSNNNLIDLSEIIDDIINLGVIGLGTKKFVDGKCDVKPIVGKCDVKSIVESILLEKEQQYNSNEIISNNNYNAYYNYKPEI